MSQQNWSRGDWAIYRKPKRSPSPGKRAQNVMPSEKGELYSYTVDKYWVVKDVLANDQLLLVTRRGKEHTISIHDPALKRPNFLQRWLYKNRFGTVFKAVDDESK